MKKGAGKGKERQLTDEELLEDFDHGDPIVQELWDLSRRLDIIDMATGEDLPDGLKADEAGVLEQLTPPQLFTWTMGEVLRAIDQLREMRRQICLGEYRAQESRGGEGGETVAPPPARVD